MYRNIFLKTLRDGRRSTILVSAGLFLIGLYIALLYPDVASGFADLIEDLPDFFKAFVGSAEEFATPEGFFSADPYSVLAPVILIALAIHRGMGAVAGEEEGQTLDQLICNPISRNAVLLHKSGALLVVGMVPVVSIALSIVSGAAIMSYDIWLGGLFQMSVSLILLVYAAGFMALGIGAATGSKTLAMAVPASLTALGYIVNLVAPQVEELQFTQYLSIAYYYIGDKPFVHGITPWHALVLLAISIVSLGFGAWRFNRRDLA